VPTFYQGGRFSPFATDPRVQSWPCTQFVSFTVSGLAGSGTQVIVVEGTAGGDNTRWLLGANNILAFAVYKDAYSGAIRVDLDLGDGSFRQAFMFPLTGEGIVDTLTGFELGGLAARFTFVNGLNGPTAAIGWLQLRSW